MYQLKQLIDRTAIRADPRKDSKAVEDFFFLVWQEPVVASAKVVLTKKTIVAVDVLAEKMVEKFVELCPSGFPAHSDDVYTYGLKLFNLGLLYHGFHDAIRGDDDRVILYWKALLIIFRTSNCHNYSKEALLLLVQQQTLPKRWVMQMKWSRYVNNKGRKNRM